MNKDLKKIQYIYKYVHNGIEKYVGITNNLSKRINQHTKDKLKEMNNPDIYYFPVKYRNDAEMLETYLINHYHTGNYYNIAKAQKGDYSFLDICDKLPWVLYKGNVNKNLNLFSVSDLIGAKNTGVIYKTKKEYVDRIVYVDDNSSIDLKISKRLQDEKELIDYLNCEIQCENQTISDLKALLINTSTHSETYDFIKKGLYLHGKRLRAFKAYEKEFRKVWFQRNEKRLKKLLNILIEIRQKLETHENIKYDADWRKDYYSYNY